MAANRLIDELYRCVMPADGSALGDDELLGRYVEQRDEMALAALVRRHAPMVWGVCLRALRDHHEAEDAFQATFLVLVRKAESVSPRGMVGNWLYGVAHQATLQARRALGRRRTRESPLTHLPHPPAAPPAEVFSEGEELDRALVVLPAIYRAVVVLCDLEGRTRKEAAAQLGVPEGTVGGRLARARALLAKRLARRGVGASVGTLLASQTVAVPPLVLLSTQGALGAGAVSSGVAALVTGVLQAMLTTKLKTVAVLVLLSAVTLGGVGAGVRLLAGAGIPTPAVPVRALPRGGANDDRHTVRDTKQDVPAKQKLTQIQPPGGEPLVVTGRDGEYTVEGLAQVTRRLEALPPEEFEKWATELERLRGQKFEPGLSRQACRTYFATRFSVAFDGLHWNARAAAPLLQRVTSLPAAEAVLWKEAFEAVLKLKIGQTATTNLPGGPAYAIPLVLAPVPGLYEGTKYSVERGKKYRARLTQLTAGDVRLWQTQVDRFGGTALDAAINIILRDEFFPKERFQREKFRAAVRVAD
ncbi:MAG: RNA polymerase sigma factor [Gemmataceae bacterium]